MVTNNVVKEPQVGRGARVQCVAHFEESIQSSASKGSAVLMMVAPRADDSARNRQKYEVADEESWLVDQKKDGEVDQRQGCDQRDGKAVLGKAEQAIFSKAEKGGRESGLRLASATPPQCHDSLTESGPWESGRPVCWNRVVSRVNCEEVNNP